MIFFIPSSSQRVKDDRINNPTLINQTFRFLNGSWFDSLPTNYEGSNHSKTKSSPMHDFIESTWTV